MMLSRRLLSAASRSATTAAARPLLPAGAVGGVGVQSLHARLFRSRSPTDRRPSPTKRKSLVLQDVKDAYSRKDFRHALKILQDSRWNQVEEYRDLIFSCGEAKQLDMTVEVLVAVMERKDKAAVEELHHKVIFLANQVLKVHAKHGKLWVACELFVHFFGEAPDAPLPSWFEELHYTTPDLPKSQNIKYLAPLPFQLVPTSNTYAVMLAGTETQKKGRIALDFVKDAARRGIELTETGMNFTMRACAREIEIENAKLVMKQMDKQGIEIDFISFLLLLEAQGEKGHPPETVFAVMASRGLHPSVFSYRAAGKYTEALAFYNSISPKARTVDHYRSALTCAAETGNVAQMDAILREMEAANISIEVRNIRVACGVFQEGLNRRKHLTLEEMEEERPCLDTIMRIIRENGLCVLKESLVQTLIDHDRRHEAEALAEHWIRHRGGNLTKELDHNIKTIGATDALNLLYGWPTAIYLFEETIFKTRGETRMGTFLFAAAVRILEHEELNLEKDDNSHSTRRLFRHIALKAYRDAMAKGWTGHNETHSPWTINVHKYTAYHSLRAVEMVLGNLAADLLEGKTKEIEDLEIITGRGVHSAAEKGQRGQYILRKKLAQLLVAEHLLSFVDARTFLNPKQSGGRIRIKKEKIEDWIRRYNWDQKQRQRKELLLD